MDLKIGLIVVGLLIALNASIAQQTITKRISQGDLEREYIIYVPAVYDGNTAVPLMFNFHGFTGQANGHLNSTRMKIVADTAGFIVVSPQGSLFFSSTHWNVGSWTRGSMADDLGFTAAMIDSMMASYNIDPGRVYSCGYSNGGYFSFELACQLSDRIAAIGAVGAKMSSETFNACSPTHPTPVVTIHGTQDNVVTYFGSTPVGSKSIDEVNNYWKEYNNTSDTAYFEDIPNTNTSDGSIVEYFSFKGGDHCTAVDHYKVIGGGHDWPGAWGNKDIDASSIIWNFCSRYDINGLISCQSTALHDMKLSESDLNFYPNPSMTTITLEMDLKQNILCKIYSSMGESILEKMVGPNDVTVDVSTLRPGNYLLKVGNKSGKMVKLY